MKQTKIKKLLSFVIAAVMILTLIPVGSFSVFAADAPAGSGTEADPYLIDDKATWEYISANAATYASSYLKVTNDIVATASGETLSPLFGSTAFSGTLDGMKSDGNRAVVKGFTLTNCVLSTASFSGHLKNIDFEGLNATDQSWYWGMFSQLCKGSYTITNVLVKNCTVTKSGTSRGGVGGFFGKRDYAAGGTYNNVDIDNLNLNVAGYSVGAFIGTGIGTNTTSFTDCSVTNSTISATSNYVGGFIGGVENYSNSIKYNFTRCESLNNTVTGAHAVSLMVGSAGHATVTFTDCTVSGKVTGTRAAAGFIGKDKNSTGSEKAPGAIYTFDNVSVVGLPDGTPTVIKTTGTTSNDPAGILLGSIDGLTSSTVNNNSTIENVNVIGYSAGLIGRILWRTKGGTHKMNLSDLTMSNVTLNGSANNAAFMPYASQPYTLTAENVTLNNVKTGTVTSGSGYLYTANNLSGTPTVTNVKVTNSSVGEISDFYEQSAEGDGVRHYRISALSTADREAYDMKVTAVYDGYNYEWVADENAALETLDAYNGLGENMGLSAETVAGNKFIAVVILNAPKAAIDFNVSISYTDGAITWVETCTVSYDANGVCQNSVAAQ